MAEAPFRYPIWVRGDLDGFFGLMVDNLVQVLLIVALCASMAGIPADVIYTRVLPGVAVSLAIGNLIYGIQAQIIARRRRDATTTALPYGINTPSVFAYVWFIMAPVYSEAVKNGGLTPAAAGDLAWKAGLLACLVSGVIEFASAFVGERLRLVTPRAALLGVLAAVGITFIAADFAFRIYSHPLIGILPLGILLLAYFGRYRFPAGLPGGLLALATGAAIAWLLSIPQMSQWTGQPSPMSGSELASAATQAGWVPPVFVGREILDFYQAHPDLLWRFLTVSIPMGLLNALGSLQNIESAAAAGDRFHTGFSLAVNGIGSIAAGLFGSCFPTTIYIGHPAWKSLGARSGYSILNGIFFTLVFLFGLGAFLAELVPIEAGAAIVVYIGIVITAQAFSATPRAHAPAVALALFPAVVALIYTMLWNYFDDAGAARTLASLVAQPTPRTTSLPGILALTGGNSSWLVSTVLLTAMAVALIDRRYKAAAVWTGIAAVLTAIGLLHAYRIEGNVLRELFIWQATPAGAGVYAFRAIPVAIGYALAALVFGAVAYRSATRPELPAPPEANAVGISPVSPARALPEVAESASRSEAASGDTHVMDAISHSQEPADLVDLEDEPERKRSGDESPKTRH